MELKEQSFAPTLARKLGDTAHVSGLAALIRLQNPTWTPVEVKSHLLASADRSAKLDKLCVSEGIAHYGRAICGPLAVLSPSAGDKLAKGTNVQITWTNTYRYYSLP